MQTFAASANIDTNQTANIIFTRNHIACVPHYHHHNAHHSICVTHTPRVILQYYILLIRSYVSKMRRYYKIYLCHMENKKVNCFGA